MAETFVKKDVLNSFKKKVGMLEIWYMPSQ